MDLGKLVEAQRSFFMSRSTKPAEFRLRALGQLRDVIWSHEKDINDALRADLGKRATESYMSEIGMVLEEIGFAISHLREWMAPKKVTTPISQFKATSTVTSEALGVVLIMAPWNYPLQLNLIPLVGAISAGNCAIIKPSSYAPATSSLIAQMISEAFPAEYIAVIEGGRESNTDLLQQKFDHIFFTGSTAVGKVVMQAAAANLTPVTLELGGKSPVIIDENIDFNVAGRRIMFGKVLNAGQTCTAPDYILAPKKVHTKLVASFKKVLEDFFPNSDMSALPRIINKKHFDRLCALLDKQDIVLGGGYDAERLFIEPTVLVNVDPASAVMQEEIFGPILPILSCESIEEAISFVQNRPKPLALYLFTKNRETEKKVLNRCDFGGGCINDTVMHLASPHLPFGGVGESGMGAYHGKKSFDTFSHQRSILRRSSTVDLPLRYHPYTDRNLSIIKRFLG